MLLAAEGLKVNQVFSMILRVSLRKVFYSYAEKLRVIQAWIHLLICLWFRIHLAYVSVNIGNHLAACFFFDSSYFIS